MQQTGKQCLFLKKVLQFGFLPQRRRKLFCSRPDGTQLIALQHGKSQCQTTARARFAPLVNPLEKYDERTHQPAPSLRAPKGMREYPVCSRSVS